LFITALLSAVLCVRAARSDQGKLRSTAAAGDGMLARAVSDPVLECHALHKRFGEIVAVRDVSFRVGEGETYGLLGPNGAGKTTSISMICGLLEPDGGEVAITGRPLTTRSVEVKGAIGYVPQGSSRSTPT
jgi:ABC-type Mn2+/Zn2+ transport system ATPase subunit